MPPTPYTTSRVCGMFRAPMFYETKKFRRNICFSFLSLSHIFRLGLVLFLFSGLLVGFVVLKDRGDHAQKFFLKKIMTCIIFLLYGVSLYLATIRQINDVEADYSCPLNDYTVVCQVSCWNGTKYLNQYNCSSTFCIGY